MSSEFEDLYADCTRPSDERILIDALLNFEHRDEVRALLPDLEPEAFSNPRFGELWAAAQKAAQGDRIITVDVLREYSPTEAHGYLDRIPDPVRLIEVTRGIDLLKEAWQRRKFLSKVNDVLHRVPEIGYDSAMGVLHDAMQELDADQVAIGSFDAGDIVDRFWQTIENPELELPPISTPWPEMNRILGGGFRHGQMVVVGAPTGGGKSIILNQTAIGAVMSGRSVAMFSLEMDEQELVRRMVASQTDVKMWDLKKDRMSPTQRDIVRAFTDAIREEKLRIFDTAEIDMEFVSRQSRIMHRQVGLDLTCVDYVQILDGRREHAKSRELEVSGIAKDSKTLARSLGTVVMIASQLNDEREEGAAPTLRSFRESKAIAHHADVAILVHRERDTEGITDDGYTGNVEINCAKVRNGSPGRFIGLWEADRGRIAPRIGAM